MSWGILSARLIMLLHAFLGVYFFSLVLASYSTCFRRFFFFFLATPCGMQDLSSPTRDWTYTPCSGSPQKVPYHNNLQPIIWLIRATPYHELLASYFHDKEFNTVLKSKDKTKHLKRGSVSWDPLFQFLYQSRFSQETQTPPVTFAEII